MHPPSIRRAVVCAGILLTTAAASAQTFVSSDADRRAVHSQTTVSSNQTIGNVPTLVITGEQVWTAGNYRISQSNGSRCDLVVANGGMLRIEDSDVEFRGNVTLQEGGTLQLIRCVATTRNSFPRQYNWFWEGGHLYTKHATIGGFDNGSSQITNFWVNRGMWVARQTTVQYSGGILMGITGGFGSPDLKGGTLDADGLYSGRNSDAIVMLGHGDATLRNSRYGLKLDLNARQAGNVTLDLATDQLVAHRVYGDRNVHTALDSAPVTTHIPGSQWRLEIENSIVDDWFLAINEVRNTGPAFEVTLENADSVSLRLGTEDLQGSPQLIGPWRTYYPLPRRLPGLPAAGVPGGYGIPPGCGVRIGNATYRAPANQWIYPSSWAFNFRGAANFSIQGSMRVGEMYLAENARLTLEGDAEYNAGITAQTIDVDADAQLTIRNATVGNTNSFAAAIIAYASADVTLENVVFQNVLLRTTPGQFYPYMGVNQATITATNLREDGTVNVQQARANSVVLDRATPTENHDLQNLGFDTAVSGGRPDHWAVTSINGYRSTTRLNGPASFGYRSTTSSGKLFKSLDLPQGVDVSFSGWLRAVSVPSSANVRVSVVGSSGQRRDVFPVLTVGDWVYFRTAPMTVASNDNTVELSVSHGGSSGTVDILCDSFEAEIASWWEPDNLFNSRFEDPFVYDIPADDGNSPNHWVAYSATSAAETQDIRPGAVAGSRAIRLTHIGPSNVTLSKRLPFVRPGQTIRVRGWVKPLPGNTENLGVFVGEDNGRWWDTTYGNNVSDSASGNSWRFVDLTYVVPSGSLQAEASLVRILSRGDCLADDFEVTIQ